MTTVIKQPGIDGHHIVSMPAAFSGGVAQTSVNRPRHTETHHQHRLSGEEIVSPQVKSPAPEIPLQVPPVVADDPRIEEGLLREFELRSRLEALEGKQESILVDADKKGYAEGFERGVKDGYEQIKQSYQEGLNALSAVNQSAQDMVVDHLHQENTLIAEIVFEAVCKLVGKHLETPAGCASVIRQVIARIEQDELLSLQVSPRDYALLQNSTESNQAPEWVNELLKLPITPNDEVELGGCQISLKGGTLDGRIETQFRQFAQRLKHAVGNP